MTEVISSDHRDHRAGWGALALISLSLMTGCSQDKNGYSTFDASPSAATFDIVARNYGDMAKLLRSERSERFKVTRSPFADGQIITFHDWAEQTYRAVNLTKVLLEKGRFELSGGVGGMDSGPILYEEKRQNSQYAEVHTRPEYADALKEAQITRQLIISTLRDSIRFIQEHKNLIPSDAASGQITAHAIEALPILADRIEQKTLLAGNNILNRWHKTGSTAALIGQTEHLAECEAGLDFLRR
jgi:hypothetical protein